MVDEKANLLRPHRCDSGNLSFNSPTTSESNVFRYYNY